MCSAPKAPKAPKPGPPPPDPFDQAVRSSRAAARDQELRSKGKSRTLIGSAVSGALGSKLLGQ